MSDISRIPGERLPDTTPGNGIDTPKRRLVIFGSGYLAGGDNLRASIVTELEARGIAGVDIQLFTNVDNIQVPFGEADNSKDTSAGDLIGVIALSNMRHYSEYGGGYVSTPVAEIEALCLQNGVPLALFRPEAGEDVTEGVGKLFAQTPPELTAA